MSDISPIEKVDRYLDEAGIFYLATEDGAQAKCRPISFHMLVDGVEYFGVGTFKEVYRQLVANPRAEFCACTGQTFLRYFGTAEFVEDEELVEKALDKLPMLRGIYSEETGNKLGIFKLVDATAEFRSLLEVEESYSL